MDVMVAPAVLFYVAATVHTIVLTRVPPMAAIVVRTLVPAPVTAAVPIVMPSAMRVMVAPIMRVVNSFVVSLRTAE